MARCRTAVTKQPVRSDKKSCSPGSACGNGGAAKRGCAPKRRTAKKA